MSAADVRVSAVRVMQRLSNGGGSLTTLLPVAQSSVTEKDRALLQAMCFGMARWSQQLQSMVDALLSKPLRQKDSDVYLLLQLGVFQLLHMRIAPHAAVDNTVKAAGKLGKPWARGLVNAVLRNCQRQQKPLLDAMDKQTRLSYPDWLLEQLRADWPLQWRSICEEGNKQAPLTLRVNQRHQSVEQYKKALDANGIEFEIHDVPNPFLPAAITLIKPMPVEQLPQFSEGAVSVQDAAAQLAAEILPSQHAKARLLDGCAAPGGKTAHALERHQWQQVVAIDSDAKRLERVRETMLRLNLLERAVLTTTDARDIDQWWDGQTFDAVLLDAPCSGTGVIRRHPDIKLLRRKTDIATLVKTQQELLNSLWQTVSPGGRLLYATCSVLKCENEEQIERFIEHNTDAKLVELPVELLSNFSAAALRTVDTKDNKPSNKTDKSALRVGLQILPGEQGMDGFYYALLEKQA